MVWEPYATFLVLIGLLVLAVGALPRFVETRPLSKPPLFILAGIVLFSLPIDTPPMDPVLQGDYAERLAELGVIIALMTAGLKIDRVPSVRGWASAWRLLLVTMPVTFVLAAIVGWWAGLAVPTAILFGAVIAPTDPVMASEVMVEGPFESGEASQREGVAGGEDEVRFGLTAEAGLNDGLAFPLTNLAIAIATLGLAPGGWLEHWLLVDVLYRIAVATVGGALLGWVVARVVFAGTPRSSLSRSVLGLQAIGGTLLIYGAIELGGAYGFIGVFIASVVIRNVERRHVYYDELHDVSEMTEQVLMAVIMTLFGGLIAKGLFEPLTVELVIAAVLVVFLVRPIAGVLAFLGFERSWSERMALSIYGLRGIGTLYYLAYGLNEGAFQDPDAIWALAGLTILISIIPLGFSATPVIERWLGDETPHQKPVAPREPEN